MFYVGLDIHTTHITVCILDGNGKVVSRCQVRRTRAARRPRTQEEGGGRDGSLPGPRDVGHDETRHLVERDGCGARRDVFGSGGVMFAQTSPTKGLRLSRRLRRPSVTSIRRVTDGRLRRRDNLQGVSQSKDNKSFHVEIESGIQVASRRRPRRFDAALPNGSNRILSNGAPPRRMMPNGRLGIPRSSRSRS